MHEALKFREHARALRRCEQTFKRRLANRCGSIDIRRISFVNELAHGLARFPSRVSLDDYMTYTHWPHLRHLFSELDTHFGSDEEFQSWRGAYWDAINAFVTSSKAQLERRDWEKLGPLFGTLDAELPSGLQHASLAQKAWWFVGSRPGVAAVLAGARQPKYAEDIHDLAERWDE